MTLVALLAVLGRPSWWILGLAGFLVRGGILIFLVAIVALPSPLALSNVLGPIVTPIYLGRLEPGTALVIGGAIGLAIIWFAAGSWFAAAIEVALVRDARRAASEEGLTVLPERRPARLLITRAMAAHLLALVPLAVAIGIGSVRILNATYAELTNPSDASSIVIRVIARASATVAVIAIVWIVGEIVGGMAVRRVVLGDESAPGAVGRSALDLVRRPGGALLAPVATTAVLVVDLLAVLTVVAIVWGQVRERVVHLLADPVATGLSLATLGAGWCLALLVTGLIDAWRSVAMTLEAERAAVAREARSGPPRDADPDRGPIDDGTIGASTHRHPGDWSAQDRGGSL
ncbi:MAG: hypothetical protein H0V73_11985 [Chloroflexi bacterium]|nr:hypothetical protein [Chloroflexota bacterium]